MGAGRIRKKIEHFTWLALQWLFGVVLFLAAFGSLIGDDADFQIFLGVFALGCFSIPPIRAFFRAQFEKIAFDPSILNPFSKKQLYKKEMIMALEDGVLTEQEASDLEKTAEALGIKDSYVEKLRHKDFEGRIKPVIKRIETARRFSPDDERELSAIAEKLQINEEFGDELKVFRDLWEYENSGTFALRVIDAPILLKGDEECYFQAPAVWAQLKRGEQTPMSEGSLYVTNKKIVFDGSQQSANITMGRVVQTVLYRNGIEVRKSSGKPDFFEMAEAHAEYVAALIRVIVDKR